MLVSSFSASGKSIVADERRHLLEDLDDVGTLRANRWPQKGTKGTTSRRITFMCLVCLFVAACEFLLIDLALAFFDRDDPVHAGAR